MKYYGDKIKKIQFGMPTLIETETIDKCASIYNTLGLDFIELNMNLPQYQVGTIDVEHLKLLADKYKLFYSIHLDENTNVCDFNPKVADAYIQTITEVISIAKTLEIQILNMHLPHGVYFTLPERKVYLFDEYKNNYLKNILNFRNICDSAIGDSPIKICIENCDGFTDFQKEAIEILLSSDVFGLTFDIGHNHGINGIDEPFILAHKDRICHMHMHDALGKKNHLALGDGELDISQYLSLAEACDCSIVLETKTINGLSKSAAYIYNNYKRLMDS